MFDARARQYLAAAPLGRLATADAAARPHVVPVCFARVGDDLVTPIDEKPKTTAIDDLRRLRDVAENPRVALVVDHYVDDWSRLGWLQVRGTAVRIDPDDSFHPRGVAALRAKYDQYADHALEKRPLLRIEPASVLTWGCLSRPPDTA
jgi:PPOX class probable F420-dependent enzyme